MQLIAVVVL